MISWQPDLALYFLRSLCCSDVWGEQRETSKGGCWNSLVGSGESLTVMMVDNGKKDSYVREDTLEVQM